MILNHFSEFSQEPITYKKFIHLIGLCEFRDSIYHKPIQLTGSMKFTARNRHIERFYKSGTISLIVKDELAKMPAFTFFFDTNRKTEKINEETMLEYVNDMIKNNHIQQIDYPVKAFEGLTEQEGYRIASTIAMKPERYIDFERQVLKPVERFYTVEEIHSRKHIEEGEKPAVEPFKKPLRTNGKLNFPELKSKAELTAEAERDDQKR